MRTSLKLTAEHASALMVQLEGKTVRSANQKFVVALVRQGFARLVRDGRYNRIVSAK